MRLLRLRVVVPLFCVALAFCAGATAWRLRRPVPASVASARPAIAPEEDPPLLPPSDPRRKWAPRSIPPKPEQPPAKESAPAAKPAASKPPGKSFRIDRSDVIDEYRGIRTYNGSSYAATLHREAIEFGAPGEIDGVGRPLVQYSLKEVRVGDRVLATGGPVASTYKAEAREVTYARGPVEERYVLRKEGLEQIFVLNSLPEARGAITVSGTLTTNLEAPAEGTHGPRLDFTHEGASRISISEAVARDAAGRTLNLELAYQNGRMTMTLPEPWVKQAALPIEIDPTYGAATNLKGEDVPANSSFHPGNPVRFGFQTAVAYGSVQQQWLVVWAESFGTLQTRVRGQFIDAVGTLQGTPIVISTHNGDAFDVTVSYSSESNNKFLVAWSAGQYDYAYKVWYATVDAANHSSSLQGVLDPDGLYSYYALTLPDCAWSGNNWYIVADAHYSGGLSRGVIGRLINPDGTLGYFANPDPPQNFPYNNDYTQYPRVASSNGYYMVVYYRAEGLVAKKIDSGGGMYPQWFAIVKSGKGLGMQHDISAGPTGKYLVVWHDGVEARILNDDMTFDGPAFPAVTGGDDDQMGVDYATLSNQWLVVNPRSTSLLNAGVVSTAGEFTTSGTIEASSINLFPSLAYNSQENAFLLVYYVGVDYTGAANANSIVGQLVSVDAPPPPTAPANFHGTATGTNSILWQWDDLATEQYYLVFYENPEGIAAFADQNVTMWEETSIPVDNYLSGHHVRGFTSSGNSTVESPPSNSAFVYSLIHNPTGRDFDLIKDSGNSVRIKVLEPINAHFGQTGVLIEYSTNPGDVTSWQQVGGGWSQDYFPTLYNLEYGTQYYFRIRFRNGDGIESTGYSPVRGPWTTAPAAPTFFSGVPTAWNAITWSWADVNYEFGYELRSSSLGVVGVAFAEVTSFIESGLTENTTYTDYVVPFNDAGYGMSSDLYSVTTFIRPPAFGDFSAVAVSANRIPVTVRTPANSTLDQTACRIETGPTPTGPWDVLQDWSQSYGAVHDNLVPGSTHWYRIRYRNSVGVLTDYSEPRSATTTTLPPGNFSGVALSPTSIQWSWTDVDGEINYRLEDEASRPKQLIGPNLTSYIESGVLPNHLQTRHVRALNAGGASPRSNDYSRYTLLPDPTLVDFTLTLLAPSQLDVVIKPPPNPHADATGAQIELMGGTFSTWTSFGPYNSNYIAGIGLDPGVTYQVRIRFQNGDGMPTNPSPARSVFTGTPAAPTAFAGVAQGPNSIQWSWTASANATDYKLHDAGEGDQGSPPASPFLEDNLSENQPYTRHVHAMNGLLRSDPSAPDTRYTAVHNPKAADFVPAAVSTTQILVTVKPPPNTAAPQTGVKIQWRATSTPPGTGAWQLLKDFDGTYQVLHSGRTPNTSYDYRIQFRNGDGVVTPFSGAQTALTAAPPAPTAFAGVAKDASSIKWTWTDINGESEYRLFTPGAHDPAEVLKGSSAANTNSYLETLLPENTTQSRHLHGWNAVGLSPESNAASATTEVHEPTEADFSVLFSSSTAIEVAATSPLNGGVGVSGVKIQRSSNNTGWSEVRDFGNQYLYPDTNNVNATFSYRYRIQYQNLEGKATIWSPSKVVSLLPVLLTPRNGGSTNVLRPVLTWTPVGAKPPFTYELQIDDQANFSSPIVSITTLTSPSYTPTVDLPSDLYRWRVRAVFSPTDAGPWSEVSVFRVDTAKPGKPILESPINGIYVGEDMPSFHWSVSTDPSGATYEIQISLTTSFASPLLDIPAIESATYTLPEPLAEGTYYWRVRATDGAGNVGNYSTVGNFNLDLTAPAAVVLQFPADLALDPTGLPHFQWQAVSDPSVITYRLQVARDQEFSTGMTIDRIGILDTYFDPAPAQKLPDGTYIWRVQAQDAAGNVSISASRRLTVKATAAAPTPSIDFSNARKTNDRTPTITGRCPEVTDITISIYVNSLVSVEAQVPVQSDGTWSYTPAAQKAEGFYVIYAKATKPATQDSPFSNPTWITIDRTVNHALDVSVSGLLTGGPGGPPGPGQNHMHVSWVASPDPDVIGYYIYRALDNSPPGTPTQPSLIYSQITPVPVVGTTYCDTTVQLNTSYRYKVVAVDNTRQEE